MNERLGELFALAREIDEAITAGVRIDPEKARRLARTVLALDREGPVTDERRRWES